MFIAALFTITKIWKQRRYLPVDEWIKQLWDIYTMEYYLAVEQKKIPFMTVWIDLENIVLNEISQSEKDKYARFHSFVESNEQTEQTRKIEQD